MSDVNQFRAMRVPTALGTAVSSGTVGDFPQYTGNPWHIGLKQVQSGATSAGVYKDLLSVTGAGVLTFVAAFMSNSTAMVQKLRITIDDTVVLENVTPANNMTGRLIPGVGTLQFDAATTGIHIPSFDAVPFNKSLVVAVSTGSASTNAMTLYHKYNTLL